MAIINCKMCGADLTIIPGQTLARCDSCDTLQTVPNADNEKKIKLFLRAGRMLGRCEFDKAAAVYENIVSEFPDEAEAYWGMVLCKFGIEYVDDTRTGDKIPTCHRSSFEPLTADESYRKALDCADVVTRQHYQQEGEAIEALRKRVLAVSSREEPYDIFICFKDSASGGGRTLESVRAEEFYDKLTEKGYRVFFSPVTLQNKLGVEFEPYIFAALNSARLMLAFGSSYENYQSVWVKNEWSRYLQLVAKNSSKKLIPCYLNMEPEDLPEEFRGIQGVNFGQYGADVTLLRNIANALQPSKKRAEEAKPAQIIQQVVQGGGPNTDALVKRGYMALEDSAWADADNFFNQALNINAELGDAYLGKLLAEKRVGSIGTLAAQCFANTVTPSSKDYTRQEAGSADKAAEEKLIGQYTLPVYFPARELRVNLVYGFGYESEKPFWEKEKASKLLSLEQNRNYIRADKYADESVKKKLEQLRSAVADSFDRKIAQCETRDLEKAKQIRDNYAKKLAEAERYAKGRYEKALQRMEENYQLACSDLEAGCSLFQVKEAVGLLENLAKCKYKDSAALLQRASQLREELQAAQDARDEAKRKQELARQAERDAQREKEKALREQAEARKRTVTGVITLLVIGAVLAGIIFGIVSLVRYFTVTKPNAQYAAAEVLLEEGKTAEAAIAFGKLGDKKDARKRSTELWDEFIKLPTVAVGDYHVAVVREDGTVALFGSSYGQTEMYKSWTNVVSVTFCGDKLYALFADGTMSSNDEADNDRVKSEKNVKAIAGWKILHKDGSVDNNKDYIVALFASAGNDGIALAPDGTVSGTSSYAIGKWENLVAVANGGYHTVGLQANGRVVAEGQNTHGECDVDGWRNIVQVSASSEHTVGLKDDGTVVATGSNEYGQCDVSGWKNIVAVYCGDKITLGLTSDGRLLMAGKDYSYYGLGEGLESLRDIKLPE